MDKFLIDKNIIIILNLAENLRLLLNVKLILPLITVGT